MNTLYQLLKDFDGTKAKSIDELTQSFEVIAQRVLYGGHFLINDDTEIYPHEIEFYYFNEDSLAPKELTDSKMYHKGKGIRIFQFFPSILMSLELMLLSKTKKRDSEHRSLYANMSIGITIRTGQAWPIIQDIYGKTCSAIIP